MWVVAALLCLVSPEVSFEGTAQGTTYHIRYIDKDQRNLKKQVDSILSDIDRALSTYRTDSEISTFNQFDDFRYQSGHFYPVLKRSYEIYKATGGALDPTVMPLTEAYRKGKRTRRSWLGQVDSLLQYVGFQYITFDTATVHKTKANVRLDFDAIAQGYTVDVIAAYLEGKGISDYIVEVGGELRCRGSKTWPVQIEDPLHRGQSLFTLTISNRAVATSGNYNNHYEQDGQLFSHIIHPKTGVSRPDPLLSATVFAKDAMTADAYATALMVLGLEGAKHLLSKEKGLNAILVYSDGGQTKVFSGFHFPFIFRL
jgi:thiamine biosynthesis lipoprotein